MLTNQQKNNAPIFIVFEGIDGSGKSTQAKMLSAQFTNKNIPHILKKEPGDTPIGEKIRELLSADSDIGSLTELFLFSAARKELMDKEIVPALGNNISIILDRYIYSTIAYQGYGRNLDFERITQINNIATNGLQPDIVFLLDIDPTESSHRMNSTLLDRIESEPIEFYDKVRNGYLSIAQKTPSMWIILDASKSPSDINSQIWEYLR
jgi:dTMP kinase